jgi:hypothetical protein
VTIAPRLYRCAAVGLFKKRIEASMQDACVGAVEHDRGVVAGSAGAAALPGGGLLTNEEFAAEKKTLGI